MPLRVAMLALMVGIVPALGQGPVPPLDLLEEERWYQLGEILFTYEEAAARLVGEGASCLRNDAIRWQEAVPVACVSSTCREEVYRDRIASFSDFVPESFRTPGFERAFTPRLVTVLAPEPEAGPGDDAAAPDMAAEGTLEAMSEDIYKMGLGLRTAEGESHILVWDMELGASAGHETLQRLIAEAPGRRYLVRGVQSLPEDTVSVSAAPDFDTKACRYVYALP